MATTVAQAFDEFADKIKPTEAQEATIASRQKSVDGYLRDAFGPGSNMPLLRTKLIGSAARKTIIRPVDDVDVIAVFDDTNVWATYRSDSRKLLYRVRQALNEYRIKVVGARGQAVRLFFTNGPNVDIAPVFVLNTGGYYLPRGDGGWVATDPDVHDTFLARRNQELGGRLKRITRFVKRWNRVHSRRLRAFHLEMITQASFRSLGNDSRAALQIFFEYAYGNLGVSDPAGHSGNLAANLSWAQRMEIRDSLTSAYQRAKKANEAELAGDHRTTIGLWRIILGDEFPAYG